MQNEDYKIIWPKPKPYKVKKKLQEPRLSSKLPTNTFHKVTTCLYQKSQKSTLFPGLFPSQFHKGENPGNDVGQKSVHTNRPFSSYLGPTILKRVESFQNESTVSNRETRK